MRFVGKHNLVTKKDNQRERLFRLFPHIRWLVDYFAFGGAMGPKSASDSETVSNFRLEDVSQYSVTGDGANRCSGDYRLFRD